MKCTFCGTDNAENAKACCNCGQPLNAFDTSDTAPEMYVMQTTSEESGATNAANSKHSKKILIAMLAVLIAVAGIFAASFAMKESNYNKAVAQFESGNYADAKTAFSALKGYKDADAYIVECDYQYALRLLEEGDYAAAIDAFTELGDYSDSASHLAQAKMSRKFMLFTTDGESEELLDDVILTTPEAAESAMEDKIYGTWYNAETGAEMSAQKYEIAGEPYCVLRVMDFDGYVYVDYCDPANTKHRFTVSNSYDYFDYIDEGVARLALYDEQSDTETQYLAITPEEYDVLVSENAEIAASQPQYSNDQVIDKTFSMFKSKIGGYYSGADTLYHSASYSDAHVEYDWANRTYLCTMIGEYTTNVFDFWGTSTQTYFVTAELMDTGSGLSIISFYIT